MELKLFCVKYTSKISEGYKDVIVSAYGKEDAKREFFLDVNARWYANIEEIREITEQEAAFYNQLCDQTWFTGYEPYTVEFTEDRDNCWGRRKFTVKCKDYDFRNNIVHVDEDNRLKVMVCTFDNRPNWVWD